jgi:hypothetical protein
MDSATILALGSMDRWVCNALFLRRANYNSACPCVALVVSGYTDRALDREAISFAKFLQKPFSFDALAQVTDV